MEQNKDEQKTSGQPGFLNSQADDPAPVLTKRSRLCLWIFIFS